MCKKVYFFLAQVKFYGSIPSLKDETINIGDVVQFDAKVEKPKDFDNTFYFFKRPTKARLLNQDQEVA